MMHDAQSPVPPTGSTQSQQSEPGRAFHSQRFLSLGYRLPRPIRRRLYGDREQHGRVIRPEDPQWQEWERTYTTFYDQTQKQSLGAIVNNAGYRILEAVDLGGRQVLEIGPGDIQHLDHWRGTPACFHMADIQQVMLDRSAARLAGRGIPHETVLLSRDAAGVLPFADAAFDVLISFFAFEHLHPFETYLQEMLRVLRPGGVIVGAIPAEGGLAWGLGRFLTSRRWLRRHTSIDPDKIICWEHPNYAEHLLRELTRSLHLRTVAYWPLRVPAIDLNLVVSFVLEKPRSAADTACQPAATS